MSHPLIDKIVNHGIDSVNVSMLSKDLRFKLLTEAGNTLMHQDKFEQAAKAFAMAENNDMLREQGNWFLQQKKYALAAYFLLHVDKEEKLQELAKDCIAANEINAARAIYTKLNDATMLEFLNQNF